ncbi:MAG: DUF58 domain-containing protein [Planctomycetota bacterium]
MITLYCLAAFILGLVLLAWLGRVYPDRALVTAMLAPTALSAMLIALPTLWPVVVAVDVLLLVVVLIDLASLAREASFQAQRSVGLIASLGQQHPVELTVTNRSGRRQPIRVKDDVPEGMTAEPEDFRVVLSPMSRSVLRYRVRPQGRGEFFLERVYLRVGSRWGFWQRQLELPVRSRINVYPDMKQLGEYAVLARTNRLSLMGLRRTRRIGQDNEFERLRDYTLDDNFKHIDWRSTARRNKLTVKDFQANQSQRIMFLVDCGRMMTGEAAGVSLLDHALNAMLMLGYVALRRSDQVGLLCFSDRVLSFTPPKGGSEQTSRLLHAAYNRFPEMVESRYDEAFLHLATHVRKRTLVVLITNVVDEVNATQVRRHLAAVNGRHLPLAVLLRDHALFDAVAQAEPAYASLAGSGNDTAASTFQQQPAPGVGLSSEKLFRAAAAAEVLSWRRRVLADLETSGVLLVDEFAEDLTAPLVNRYLEAKARHLL